MKATEYSMDFRTLTPGMTTYHGVYGEDFITFAEFGKDVDPGVEEDLLKIFDEGSDAVLDKHTFKFDENLNITYSRDVNAAGKDTETHQPIEETQLNSTVRDSWSETFFYGIGNKSM